MADETIEQKKTMTKQAHVVKDQIALIAHVVQTLRDAETDAEQKKHLNNSHQLLIATLQIQELIGHALETGNTEQLSRALETFQKLAKQAQSGAGNLEITERSQTEIPAQAEQECLAIIQNGKQAIANAEALVRVFVNCQIVIETAIKHNVELKECAELLKQNRPPTLDKAKKIIKDKELDKIISNAAFAKSFGVLAETKTMAVETFSNIQKIMGQFSAVIEQLHSKLHSTNIADLHEPELKKALGQINGIHQHLETLFHLLQGKHVNIIEALADLDVVVAHVVPQNASAAAAPDENKALAFIKEKETVISRAKMLCNIVRAQGVFFRTMSEYAQEIIDIDNTRKKSEERAIKFLESSKLNVVIEQNAFNASWMLFKENMPGKLQFIHDAPAIISEFREFYIQLQKLLPAGDMTHEELTKVGQLIIQIAESMKEVIPLFENKDMHDIVTRFIAIKAMPKT